jgi:hypothetical protein
VLLSNPYVAVWRCFGCNKIYAITIEGLS